jgi:hypothetical protein
MIIVGTNGRVGISNGSPGYQLDVTADATSNAAINASTWTRIGASTTHMVKGRTGIGSTSSTACLFDTPAISLDANLGTVTNDSQYGTYFVCKRSGLWTINATIHGNGVNPTLVLDVCNSVAYNDTININSKRHLVGVLGGYYYASVSFTGYLPSNNNLFYKIRSGGYGGDLNGNLLYIAFHNELPAATGFPYV